MKEDLRSLRSLARLDRQATLEGRVRRGEDPATVVAEIGDVDDFVVKMLHDDALEAQGLTAEFALAKLAQYEGGSDAEHFREATDAVEARILRELGRDYPQLSRAVWRRLAEVEREPLPNT